MRRRKLALLGFALLASMVLMAACAPTNPTPPQPPATPKYSVQVVSKDGTSREVDLSTLEPKDGNGGFIKSTGTIVGPDKFKGVSLDEVLEKAGGFTDKDALEVTATDGYTMTLTYEQVKGLLMVYDKTSGQALKVTDLDTMLITSSDGDIFSSELPRLAFSSSDGPISDGHFWVKSIAKLTVIEGVSDWEIALTGVESLKLDRSTFESMAECPDTPHPAAVFETTTKEGDPITYEGVPLWLVISMFDGGDAEGGHYLFNGALAEKGYTIEVVAADGMAVEFTSKEVARNADIIVAYKVDGKALGEDEGPLRLVGSGLPSKKHGVKQIAEIRLTNLPE